MLSIYSKNHISKLQPLKIVCIVLLFFLVSFVGINYHELWLDESHHFLLGRDSNSFQDLFQNTRYDGHPILWNYFIHLITRFSNNPFYMQLLHIVISSITVYIFLKKTPFKLWFKIAFLCSYFMLYEYTVISRNYNLGVLFLFLACSLYQRRKESFTYLCVFLALCCNTHSIFTIISFGFLLSLFSEQLQDLKFSFFKKYWKGYLIFLIGFLLAYFQILPKSDTPFFDRIDYTNVYELGKSVMSLFKALFPIVDFTQEHYWNRFYFIEHFRAISLIIGIILWFLPFVLFRKNLSILIFVYSTLLGFILFTSLIQIHGVRYNGILFLAIIIGLWMMHYQEPKVANRKLHKLKTYIIIGLMTIQVIAGISAYSLDINRTFSHGKNTAYFLQSNNIPIEQIITACESSSINAYMNQNLHNLCYQKPQGFYLWNIDCSSSNSLSKKDLIKNAFIQKSNQKTLVFILNDPIEKKYLMELKNNSYSFLSVGKFENAVTHNYYIYKIERHEK